MARPPLVAWMNPLPMELAPALRRRRQGLAAAASGRVLDLGGWNDHLRDYDIGGAATSVTMLDRLGDVRAGTGSTDPDGVIRLDIEPEELREQGHGPFDTIVSLIRTPLVADLDGFLNTLIDLMADRAHLFFLEPVTRSGRVGRALAASGVVGRALGGLHLDRDLPVDIRALGISVTDLERFEVSSVSAPLRPFIEARARWPFTPQ